MNVKFGMHLLIRFPFSDPFIIKDFDVEFPERRKIKVNLIIAEMNKNRIKYRNF